MQTRPERRRTTTIVASTAAILALLASVVAVSRLAPDDPTAATAAGREAEVRTGTLDGGLVTGDGTATPGSTPADATGTTTGGSAGGDTAARGTGGSRSSAGAPSTRGLTPARPTSATVGKEILVAYYWKGDRTRTSPYLRGTGADSNLDEGKAFLALVDYVNAHADGGATLMGFPFDLHGRKLKGVVLEAGQSPEQYAATAEKLVSEVKPFAAVAAHGSLSAYVCPRLAKAGIFSLATFDVDFDLVPRTGGWCLPFGPAWRSQVEITIDHLRDVMGPEPYAGPAGTEPRRFGVAYAEYPGLVDSAPKVVDMMKKAGIPVVASGSISDDLTTAQQQVGSLIARFRAAGVNTVVFPDSGAPLTFTQNAEAQGWRPDYYVWPCSGQDFSAMVRLFNPAQWSRASGLTCYDAQFNTDLAHDDRSRATEWYRAYRSVRPGEEPPASTGLVWSSMLALVAGVTGAGPDLSEASFRSGLDRFSSYRYDGMEGRTTDPTNLLLTLGRADRSLIGDYTRVRWSSTARTPGSAFAGTYVYPDPRRVTTGSTR